MYRPQAVNRDKEKCLCFFSLCYKQQQQKTLKAQDIFYLSLEKSEINQKYYAKYSCNNQKQNKSWRLLRVCVISIAHMSWPKTHKHYSNLLAYLSVVALGYHTVTAPCTFGAPDHAYFLIADQYRSELKHLDEMLLAAFLPSYFKTPGIFNVEAHIFNTFIQNC